MLEVKDVILVKAASLSAAQVARGWALEANDVTLVMAHDSALAKAATRSHSPAAKTLRCLEAPEAEAARRSEASVSEAVRRFEAPEDKRTVT